VFAIRYVALLALVIWLGGMILLALLVAPSTFQVLQAADPVAGRVLAGALFGDILRHFHLVAYACGIVILVCLFAIKFLGPPPRAFVPRAAIVFVMLLVAAYSGYSVSREIAQIQSQTPGPMNALTETDARRVRFDRLHRTSTALMTIDMALGLVLLFWYIPE
jgi:hypothetical protein